jgi:hypothetical protein
MPDPTIYPTPEKRKERKTPEFFGLDWKLASFAVVVSIIALVVGIFQSLTSFQRDQVYGLEREVVVLQSEVSRLDKELARTRASNEMIDKIALDLFQLRCDLQKGTLDVSTLTCQVGQIRSKFTPPSRDIFRHQE